MTDRVTLRRAWWQAHKWIALVLMILLMPLGLSGVVLAWDESIDHALHPARYAVRGPAVLPLSAYAAAAAARVPGAHVAGVRLADQGRPVTVGLVAGGGGRDPGGVHGRETHVEGARHGGDRAADRSAGGARFGGRPQRVTVWLDPGDARVIDVQRGIGGIVGVAHDFHGSLFVPGVGRALVGLLGIAMFLMAVSGVWLWWPLRGRWTRGMQWRRGDTRTDTNLHHQLGFWIALPLAIQAFTGVWIAWPQMAALAGAAPSRGGPDRMRGFAPLDTPATTADAAVAAARAGTGGGPAQALQWPTRGEPAWRVTLAGPQGRREVAVDDASGATRPARPRGGGIAGTVRHLHDGTLAGPVWRVLMIPLGLAPTVLGITGLLMWWRGRGRRLRAAARARERTLQPA